MQWFPGDVSMAIQVSRKNKALLVVYISSDSPDGKIFDEFWQQIDSNNLLCPVVGIKLKEGETAAKQFADIYPTPILPAAYLIDHEGKPIEVITSLVGKTYDAFRGRFDRGTASFVNAIGKSAPSQPTEAPSVPRTPEAAPAPPADTNPTSSTSSTSTQNSSQNDQALNRELAEKVARAKKLLELKKARDAHTQKESERKQREEMAKASEAKRARDEKAIAEAAKLRKKEKEEAQKDKERILAQIKADREDAQKRFNAATASEPRKAETSETSVGKSIPSDRCRLQVRLPDGSTFVEEFPSNDVLNSLVAIIQQKPSIAGSSFEVHQPYPRRVFTVDDYSKTFLDNQLTPSTALVVVLKPSTASTISKAVTTQSSSLFSLILSPLFLFWNIFTGMLGFNKPAESSKKNEGTSSGAPGASGTQQRGMPRSAEVRRRGNVAGLENPNDDDPEERANFNGNSTQFM